MKFNFFIFAILSLISIKLFQSYTFNAAEVLKDPNNYRYILCSNNGDPTYNSTTNEIICSCKEGYVNEPREKKKEFLNGHFVQCSYRQKSRFKALFFALCLPFGFDFLYLERYIIFSIVFCIVIIIIVLNIIMFIINYKTNMKNKENQIQHKFNKIRNDPRNKDKSENRKIKCLKILNFIANLGIFNHILYMIITVILHLSGIIDDGNGVNTENDLTYLFQRYSDSD